MSTQDRLVEKKREESLAQNKVDTQKSVVSRVEERRGAIQKEADKESEKLRGLEMDLGLLMNARHDLEIKAETERDKESI